MNSNTFKAVAIIDGRRIPFAKSFTHYQGLKNQELMTAALKALVESYSLKNEVLGDVALGSVMLHSSDWNLARECVLGSGLHPTTPAYDVRRACATSMDSIWQIGLKIAAGQIESGIGGGSDTNSDLPVMLPRSFAYKILAARGAKSLGERLKLLSRIRLKDIRLEFPGVVEPRTGLSMGQHCERMVQEWNVSQREQDELALMSHKNAARAYEEGFYDELVCEFHGLKKDSIVRADTSLEKLSKLKPAFDLSGKGSLTAGNSTALTDGAAAVLLCSEDYARQHSWKIRAYLKDVQVSAVDFVGGEGLLMAPTIAVAELLRRNKLELKDFDFYEIHEAFAGQVLCTLKAWESEKYCQSRLGLSKALGSIDVHKLNIKGGSVALGHPFAATGARIVAGLARLLNQKGGGRGLVSICTGGGMGVAAILEKE